MPGIDIGLIPMVGAAVLILRQSDKISGKRKGIRYIPVDESFPKNGLSVPLEVCSASMSANKPASGFEKLGLSIATSAG